MSLSRKTETDYSFGCGMYDLQLAVDSFDCGALSFERVRQEGVWQGSVWVVFIRRVSVMPEVADIGMEFTISDDSAEVKQTEKI
jgi:hypothetical protein